VRGMCWRSYGWRWEREPERTSERTNTDYVRIADSDREQAISQLSKHAGDGRLTLEEFETRAAEVYAAKTYADLRPVFRDLPSYHDARPGRRDRSHTRPHVQDGILPRLLVLLVLVFVVVATPRYGLVLLIGFWLLAARMGRVRRVRARRLRHGDHIADRVGDEQLTSV
jgi:Domain of unknown function (DUF1707)